MIDVKKGMLGRRELTELTLSLLLRRGGKIETKWASHMEVVEITHARKEDENASVTKLNGAVKERNKNPKDPNTEILRRVC